MACWSAHQNIFIKGRQITIGLGSAWRKITKEDSFAFADGCPVCCREIC
jgi:hypothetical protein